MTEKQKILNKLFSLQRFGIKPGLKRTSAILSKLDNPHNKYPTIHIAGTNGKGSVSAMIDSILMESGYKVGLYTSPHIFEFNERIRIGKKLISDDDLCDCALEVMKIGESVSATFFEITTAIAFKYFADNAVDIAVIEAGMGGRYDSTNVITPEISLITNIDLDHQEYLGDTIEAIAEEKAGIIKNSIPIVLPEFKRNIVEICKAKAAKEDSPVIKADDCSVSLNSVENDFSSNIDIRLDDLELLDAELSISGSYQIENVKLVISAIQELRKKYVISDESIRAGLKNIKHNSGLKYRIEVIDSMRPIIVDVSHNPAAVSNLVDTIRQSEYSKVKWQIIFGAMADKNIDKMLQLLKPITSELILTQASIARSEKSDNIIELANKQGFKDVKAFDNIPVAFQFIINNDKPTICLGSFYVIEEFMREYLHFKK